MNNDVILKQAQSDFKELVNNSSPNQIREAKNGVGILAMRFAMRYTNPDKNQELYNQIYDIPWSFIKNYE